MCECGCGDYNIEEAYELGDGNILGVEIYPGCKGCETGLLVAVHTTTSEQAREYWIEVNGQFLPDQTGWNQKIFPLLGQEDLVEAVEELQLDEELDRHEWSVSLLMKERGLDLLQTALRIRRRKLKEGKGFT